MLPRRGGFGCKFTKNMQRILAGGFSWIARFASFAASPVFSNCSLILHLFEISPTVLDFID